MSDYFPDPPAEESDDAAYSDGTPPEFASPEAGYAEPDAPEAVVFEELTLAEALAFLLWRPGQTLRLFWYVLSYDPDAVHARSATPVQPPVPLARGDRAAADSIAAPVFDAAGGSWQAELPQHAGGRVAAALGDLGERVTWAWIVVLSLACLLAVWGGHVLYDAAIDPAMHIAYDTNGALLWFVAAGAVVVGAELFQGRDWWARRFPRAARWLWSHIIQGPAPLAWNAGLTLALIAARWLIAVGAGGLIGAALLAVIAGGLWLALLLGNIPPAARAIPERQTAGSEHDSPVVIRSSITIDAAQRDAAFRFWPWFEAHIARLILVPVALLMSALAYRYNVKLNPEGDVTDVVLTLGGSAAWLLSIALWILILAVDVRRLPGQVAAWRPGSLWRGMLAWVRRTGWVLGAVLLITVIGGVFRLYDLDSTPPEMTSDHIEKVLDALKVNDGYYAVFFPNNGGREGFQMAVVALIANLGAGFSFRALKLATALEGLITLPVLWWMARQVFGTGSERSRQLGNWIGLALAGLVAVSSWHVMLSRLGLRIVLTPLTVALVIGFLARAMRLNRTRDYVALGVTLGAGMYFYQANRMLPILVVIGAGLALVGQAHSWRDLRRITIEVIGFGLLAAAPLLVYWYVGRVLEQSSYANPREFGERLASFLPLAAMVWFSLLALAIRSRHQNGVLQVGGGLLATVVVALALYVPMYHYSELYPEHFWNRTRGRLFGEDAFQRPDPVSGVLVTYEPSVSEQVEEFWKQRDVFRDNLRDALRMYHWEGDGAWISNADVRPALDALTGGLAILGAVMWGVWLFRERKPTFWLVPFGLLVMLLPSAMTLAYVIENPSFTRASGTIPFVFLLAALPLGLLCWWIAQLPLRATNVAVGPVVALVLLVGVLGVALRPNWEDFYTRYRLNYSYSWDPYHEIAKPLREFALGEGSYGNAFMIAYPHWLDHRILGTEAGDIRWPNGVVERGQIYDMIRRNKGTPYEYDPEKPLFFMYNTADIETTQYLLEQFPGGEMLLYRYTFETKIGESEGEYSIYKAWGGPIN